MADKEVQVKFGADTKEAEAGIKVISEKLGQLPKQAESITESLNKVRNAIVAAFAVNEVKNFVNEMGKMADSIDDTSQMLGIATKEVQRFMASVQLQGDSTEGATSALRMLAKNMAEAATGGGQAKSMFDALGISVKDSNGKMKNVNDVLYEIADAFSKTSDGANKTAFAMGLMGRTGAGMIPGLNSGSDGMKRLGDEAEKTSVILTDKQLKAFQETWKGSILLGQSTVGLSATLYSNFAPAIDYVIGELTYFIQKMTETKWVMDLMKITAIGIVSAIDAVKLAWKELTTALGTAMAQIYTYLDGFGRAVKKIAQLDFKEAGESWDDTMQMMENITAESTERMKKDLADSAKAMQDLQDKMMAKPEAKQEEKKGDLPGFPSAGVDTRANSMQAFMDEMKLKEQAARANNDELIRLEEEKLAKVKQLYGEDSHEYKAALYEKREFDFKQKEEELDRLRFKQEWYKEDYRTYLELESQKLSQLAEMYGEDSREYREELLKKQQAELQHRQQALQIYKNMFNAIDQAFSQSIRGILQGTQTWRQAMANFATNIAASFIGMAEQMLSKWIFTQIFEAASAKATAASVIMGHAGEAGAAAFASTAAIPVVGPAAAPAAAASAYAGALSFLPSAAGGWEVPHDTLAMVHKNEMILPAELSDKIRNMSDEGRGNTTVHIHANDAKSFSDMIRRNPNAIIDVIHGQTRNFNAKLQGA